MKINSLKLKTISFCVLALLASCTSPIVNTTDNNISISQKQKAFIKGKVEFPSSFKTKATLSEVGSDATVSLLYPPNHATTPNKTIATGLTDSNGNFTINPSFTPTNNNIYILEGSKRIGGTGNALISVRTYIKWNEGSGTWTSITTPDININTKTTAVTIIDAYDNSIIADDTIGKIDVTGGNSVLSPIGSVTQQNILDVDSMVNIVLSQNVDPNRFIKYQSGKYIVSKEPNHNKTTVINTKNCPSCDLSFEDLSNQNFSGGNLKYSDLTSTNLTNTNLGNANLTGANLTSSNLTGATLTGVNFTDVNLSSKNFSSFNLSGSNFSNANLSSTNLTSANLSNSILTGTTLTGATLTGTNFSNVDLTNRNFNSFNLSNANFTGSILTGVTFTSATLTGTNFTGQNLTGRNFDGFNLSNVNFTNANLSSIVFTGTTLTNVNFTGVDMSNRNFLSRNLTGSKFINSNVSNTIFTSANLTSTDFTGATMTNANFEGAIWTNGSICAVGSVGQCNPPSGELLLVSSGAGYINYPSIGINSTNGDFLISWDNETEDTYSLRFNNTGIAQGTQFKINTYTTGRQWISEVSTNPNTGDFIVLWQDLGRGSTTFNLFNSSGVAQISEVNRSSSSTASIDINKNNGDFIFTWAGSASGDSDGIFAQKYNSSGLTQGSQFKVNTYTTNSQNSPSVALNSTTGDYVITWSGNGSGDSVGIYAQRYNSSGVAQGSEFRVNTYTTDSQVKPSIALNNTTGDFVVTWQSFGQDGSNDGIYAQRYNSSGVAQGSEFRVNTYTTSTQSQHSIALNNTTGDFVVTWQSSGQDGSNDGIYAQRYNSSGVAQGSEFRVNSFTDNYQVSPDIAINDTNGDFIIIWAHLGTSPAKGVYMKRYNSNGAEY